VKISINDTQNNTQDSSADSLGVTEGEVAGPGGMSMPGGEVTARQDAGAESDDNNAMRGQSQRVEEAQQAGEIEHQTIHQTPTAGDPAHGLPVDTVESESSGVSQNNNSANNQTNDQTNDGDLNAKKNSDATFSGEQPDELTQVKNQLVQLTADFENFRRQATRRETEARERAVRSVVEDLLPVLDNFERAANAATSTSDVESLKTGIGFILQQFQEALKSHGVEPIESKGKGFDPKTHEALEEIESDQKAGTVVDDVQRGYSFKGQVLRPSRVRVAK
jgi:molecular chaperone GrpE